MRTDNIIECKGALILGAGLAGLFTALKLSPYPATVVAGARPGQSGSSAWAQGGIAAAVGEGDSWQAHARDTIVAGAGACDPAIVEMVAREAATRIDDLIALGAPFDRKPDGSLALGREAAHSAARIVHVIGDRAGAEVSRVLAERAQSTPSITLCEGFHAIELAMENGRVAGVFTRHGTGTDTRLVLFRSNAVIFATGGIGALYAVTTNPLESRGEGLGMAARAGAAIADAEFVQFHPTAIAIARDPAPLATEALRGEGAVLIDETGRRFMPAVHPDAELAPRDVVARAIHREIASGHRVFLDCRESIGAQFPQKFPTVYAACISAGIDPISEPIPVAPAAHYHMGGIATDANGRSSLKGLWAVGECASTGLHGANRL
ncbi:MAG TPA: L-aspartate oxidase, partial [Rhizomicrobium sp.]